MHHTPITEAHFVLGRVHVDVYHRRINFQKQHKCRMATVEQHVAVSLAHRVGNQLVAHHAPIYVEILQICLATGERRQTHPTPQMQAVAFDIDRQRLLEKRRATDRGHPPRATLLIRRLMQTEHGLAVVTQVEGHVKTCQGQAFDHFLQMIEFGFLSLEKLTPCRGIEEQVAHFYRGADRVRCGLHTGLHITAFGFHLPGLLGTLGA